ncbi:MAG: HEAT repeat domain-containing protein [Gammaproteobacteria bacterium]|nr:HEAT repeat domain-containing protein [Gammaproteobacteria bacterium]
MCCWLVVFNQAATAATVLVERHLERGQLISVYAKNQPVDSLLQDICQAAHVQLTLHGTFASEISVAFDKLPLNQVIRRLIANYARIWMITYADQPDNQSPLVEAIQVYLDSQQVFTTTVLDDDPAIGERLDYLEYLASGPESEALPEIAGILSARNNALIVKQRAVEILASFKSDQVAETLANGLGSNPPELKTSIINALGQLKNQQSSLILAQILYGETDNDVRLQAVEQLNSFDTPAARAFLKSAALDSNQQIQQEARYALDALDIPEL